MAPGGIGREDVAGKASTDGETQSVAERKAVSDFSDGGRRLGIGGGYRFNVEA